MARLPDPAQPGTDETSNEERNKMKTETQLKKMDKADLASYFNGLNPAAKKVTQFATTAAGIKSILALQKRLKAGDSKKIEAANKKEVAKSTAARKKAAPKAAKKAAAPKEPGQPRASTVYVQKKGLKTWAEYRSVKAAFEALDLPMGVHQGFRKDLKASGEEVLGNFTFQSVTKHKKV